jgi:histidyl-tRNA synthetase
VAARDRETERVCAAYGYRRITTPLFEDTELFTRTSGEGSDVVQKEMYTFTDRGDRSLTLRPRGHRRRSRAPYVEHGLHRDPQPVKTFLIGPMYRYSAPQRGQVPRVLAAERRGDGLDDPALDAEGHQLYAELLRRLGSRAGGSS